MLPLSQPGPEQHQQKIAFFYTCSPPFVFALSKNAKQSTAWVELEDSHETICALSCGSLYRLMHVDSLLCFGHGIKMQI